MVRGVVKDVAGVDWRGYPVCRSQSNEHLCGFSRSVSSSLHSRLYLQMNKRCLGLYAYKKLTMKMDGEWEDLL